MMNFSQSRQILLRIVPQLKNWQVFLALKFIQILQLFSPNTQDQKKTSLDIFDPLEEFMGNVDNGKLAQAIDQDLYD